MQFKVNERVWSPIFKWGTVRSVHETMSVRFDSSCAEYGYKPDGSHLGMNTFPMLFHDEIKPEDWPNPRPPLPELEIDAPVWVKFRRDDMFWCKRHFAGWEGLSMQVWCDGMTSHTCSGKPYRVDEWSLTKPE